MHTREEMDAMKAVDVVPKVFHPLGWKVVVPKGGFAAPTDACGGASQLTEDYLGRESIK
jgi:hypothetical protein